MAKVHVNTASREELLAVGGLRPELVDEIVKLRRKEKITGPEALEQVPGVGPAMLEQLFDATRQVPGAMPVWEEMVTYLEATAPDGDAAGWYAYPQLRARVRGT